MWSFVLGSAAVFYTLKNFLFMVFMCYLFVYSHEKPKRPQWKYRSGINIYSLQAKGDTFTSKSLGILRYQGQFKNDLFSVVSFSFVFRFASGVRLHLGMHFSQNLITTFYSINATDTVLIPRIFLYVVRVSLFIGTKGTIKTQKRRDKAMEHNRE